MTPKPVALDDKYTLDSGRAFMTGIQALVRLPMLQHQRDLAAGYNTAGYISGYRGSPLGAYDQQLWRAQRLLQEHDIVFNPGVNEDLAATAVWGTQQAAISGESRYDGVFAIWYGKGPGVDRSGDAFRHGNLAGSAPLGGVLTLLGDDHICESSTTAHQSEFAMVDAMIPILNPAGVQEILDYGIYGWALSRYSGCWVALKCIHDTVESSASVYLYRDRVQPVLPEDFTPPPGGLNIRWPDEALAQEARLHQHKLDAVLAFCRANQLNRVIWNAPGARVGVVTAGKSYLDVRQALEDLDINEDNADDSRLRLFKVALTWPLEPNGLRAFCAGLDLVIVVEEKRSLIEIQLKDLLYARPEAPMVIGKHDEQGRRLFPSAGRLDPNHIAAVIGSRLLNFQDNTRLADRVAAKQGLLEQQKTAPPAMLRTPYFCAGCPHSTSTRVPQGSRALAGIGCHYMAQWMDRDTARFTQMGAEGASWIGEAPFSQRGHVFQNIGDGTYFHSGLLAVRAAVAARVNITFKILFNDAVAMTGGQRPDGPLDVAQITRQVHAEGAQRIAVVTDEPDKYPKTTVWAPGVQVYHRDRLDQVQRELREIEGTTALVYDQTCASEKRRRRKRGQFPDPPERLFINDAVCEGCGDCGVQSNCVAILPQETELGRKRVIDQSACNKDYSCVKGFCPSFVTVQGGQIRNSEATTTAITLEQLPEPSLPALDRPYDIVVTGVGGTGVVTIGALLGMAAHIEGKGCSILDMMGLAQKGGAVVSHVRIADQPEAITTTRVAGGGARLLLGCDMVVTASPDALNTVLKGHTQVLVNDRQVMTGDFTRNADLSFPATKLKQSIEQAAGSDVQFLAASRLATALLGDAIASNLFMLGYAYQKGWVPVSAVALEQAITLNGVAVDNNQQALRWGRQAALDLNGVEQQAAPATVVELRKSTPRTLEQQIEYRVEFLTAYQNAAYARRYRALVDQVRRNEAEKTPGREQLSTAVAHYYFKLMAYKDEYEVARLFTNGEFLNKLQRQFSGDFKLRFHMAPPLLARRDPVSGELQKSSYGPWLLNTMKTLAKLRWLRGTPFDVLGYSRERRTERRLINNYETVVAELLAALTAENHALAVMIAETPEHIRGYGHVKERHLQEAERREAELLHAFRSGAADPKSAAA